MPNSLGVSKDEAPALAPKYEQDFYAWAQDQAALIRAGRLAEADLANIAEELADLGRSEYRELRSALARIVQHLLKWDFQASKRSPSWCNSIHVHRVHGRQTLDENPALRHKLDEILVAAYELGVAYAVEETGLPPHTFPVSCPYTFDMIMNRETGSERK